MGEAADNVVNVDAAIPEFALAGDAFTVNDFETIGSRNVGQPDYKSVAFFVSKPLANLVGLVSFHWDLISRNCPRRIFTDKSLGKWIVRHLNLTSLHLYRTAVNFGYNLFIFINFSKGMRKSQLYTIQFNIRKLKGLNEFLLCVQSKEKHTDFEYKFRAFDEK